MMRRRQRAGGAALLAATLCCLGRDSLCQPNRGSFPEIGSTVQVLGLQDTQSQGAVPPQCQQTVNNALAYQQSAINFNVAIAWIGTNNTAQYKSGQTVSVTNYCLNTIFVNSTGTCPEPSQGDIQSFTRGLAACFKLATDAGLDIAILPTLNNANTSIGVSEVQLALDPLQQYGNYSFASILLNPIADALALVATPSTRILFTLKGQGGASMVAYPQSWTQLLPAVKSRIVQNAVPGFDTSFINTGLGLNFIKICGCVNQSEANPNIYIDSYPANFAPFKSQFNQTAIGELFNATDYIIVSSTPSLTPDFSVAQLENATAQFEVELSSFGVNLTQLQTAQNKALYWSNIGLGGGDSTGMPAANSSALAAAPFYEVSYNNSHSFNKTIDPWIVPSLKAYQEYYFRMVVNYAQQSATLGANIRNSSFKYTISGLFLNNYASYDVQAISASTSNSAGSFRNPVVTGNISSYNLWAIDQNRQFLGVS